jgi:peptidoglycan/xylan/chitin deacetylase (PgdA/CDA1 family)
VSALRNRSSRAIFLCYHSVADPGPPLTSISPELFERQLGMLRARGYRPGTPAVLREICAGRTPPGRHAFLSFDDGYRDNLEVALPLMREHGYVGSVFVLPEFVDSGAALDWPEVSDRLERFPDVMRSLDWAMVEQLAEAGWEVGSHGLRHAHMPLLGDEELRQELLDSRRRVEERIGSCESLAYPFGEWDARVAAAAADAGYSFAYSLPEDDQMRATPHSIPRLMVDHRDGERRFGAKLNPAFRTLWLSPARRWARALSARARSGRPAPAPAPTPGARS